MNCLEFRHLVLTDPYFSDGSTNTTEANEAESHAGSCAQCARFRQEVLDMDSDIEKALSVPVPEGLANRVLLNQSLKPSARSGSDRSTWLRFGMAASFLAVVLIGASQLTAPDPDSPASSTTDGQNLLADATPMLKHAVHQPHEFHGSEHQPISGTELNKMMARLNMTASLEHVVYAAICPIDGERAVHLVIKDGADQYTVMLLPEHSPSKMYTVSDKLWRGYISPHPAGALAVLASATDDHAIDRVREVTARLQSEIYLSAEL